MIRIYNFQLNVAKALRWSVLTILLASGILNSSVFAQCPATIVPGTIVLDSIKCPNIHLSLQGGSLVGVEYLWESRDMTIPGGGPWLPAGSTTRTLSVADLLIHKEYRVRIRCLNNTPVVAPVYTSVFVNNPGVLVKDSLLCPKNELHMSVKGSAVGFVDYQWEFKNLAVPGSVYVFAGSTTSELNISALLHDRVYRVRMQCPNNTPVVPPHLTNEYYNRISPRQIRLDTIVCNNNLPQVKLSLVKDSTFSDTNIAKVFMWQVSESNGQIWSFLDSTKDQILYNLNDSTKIMIRSYPTTCFNPNIVFDTANYLWSKTFINDFKDARIVVADTGRKCDGDSVWLNIRNLDDGLLAQSVVKWIKYVGDDPTPITLDSGLNKPKVRVKIDTTIRYEAEIKMCGGNFTVKVAPLNVTNRLGKVTIDIICPEENFTIDYENRDLLRNAGFHVVWDKKPSASPIFQPYRNPSMVRKYSNIIPENESNDYKISLYLCENRTGKPLDTVIDSIVYFYSIGPNSISNYNCATEKYTVTNTATILRTNVPKIESFWMVKKANEGSYFRYSGPDATQTSISLQLENGLTQITKGVAKCAENSCTGDNAKFSSPATAFFPFQPIATVAGCDQNFEMALVNDTIKFTGSNGTFIFTGNFDYTWQESSNSINWTTVLNGNTRNLSRPSSDLGKKFRRLTKICPTSSTAFESYPSYIKLPQPNFRNGLARIKGEVCFGVDVKLEVIGVSSPNNTATPSYYWQRSTDDINWSPLENNKTSEDSTVVQAENGFNYYRRITMWCNPNGTIARIDSTQSVTLNYAQPLPYSEGFENQLTFGTGNYFNCYTVDKAICGPAGPQSNQMTSNPNIGKTGTGYSHQADPNQPQNIPANTKLITPAFYLEYGKSYMFSFEHIESAANLSWDSLYVVVGNAKSQPCDINEKIGDVMRQFSFDQWNRHQVEFVPCSTGYYKFGIAFVENTPSRGNIIIDNLRLKQITRCDDQPNIERGAAFAPQKIVDRKEDNPNYQKDNVTHQYCIGDTIMISYRDNIYSNVNNNFEYKGMRYQFYRKRMDFEYNVVDKDFVPMDSNSLFGEKNPLTSNKLRDHINRADWFTHNIVVTDTFTFYKIVATCVYDGREYHSDSLKVNGQHSLPYCESWDGLQVNDPMAPHAPNVKLMEQGDKNYLYSICPTCWGSTTFYTANTNPWFASQAMVNNGQELTDITDGTNGAFNPSIVVINNDAFPKPADTNTKILMFSPIRTIQGKTYQISFRWADNRFQSEIATSDRTTPTARPRRNGRDNQFTDSLYLMASYGPLSITTNDSFRRSKIISVPLRRVQSSLNLTGGTRYHYFWTDYTATQTGTCVLAIGQKSGRDNNGHYRFLMDDFCIEPIPEAAKVPTASRPDPCTDSPTFNFPMELVALPDNRTYPFNVLPPSPRWCVGDPINYEFRLRNRQLLDANQDIWKGGWKMQWERSNDPAGNNWYPVNPTYSPNILRDTLTTKFKNYRLRLYNQCGKGEIIGPFNIFPPGGSLPLREGFDNTSTGPFQLACWTSNTTRPSRLEVSNDNPMPYNQFPLSPNQYVRFDFTNRLGDAQTNQFIIKTPALNLKRDSIYRISFWYQDNGFSQPLDSILLGWTYSPSTFDIVNTNRLLDINSGNNIPKNFRNRFWKYYTAEHKITFPASQSSRQDSNFYYIVRLNEDFSNAISGYRYFAQLDNFEVKPKYNNDLIVTSIQEPILGCGLDTTSKIVATVMNLGSLPQSNFKVSAQIDNGKIGTAIFGGTLNSNAQATVEITGVEFPDAPVRKRLRVWVDHPNDMDRWDDTLSRFIDIIPKMLPPTDLFANACYSQPITHAVNTPNKRAFLYQNQSDVYPIQIGDTIKIQSILRDSVIFASTSCSYRAFAGLFDFATLSRFAYSNTTGGIQFDVNTVRPIRLRNVDVFAQGAGSGTVQLTQYGRVIYTKPFTFTRSGLNKLSLEWDIDPGTDYIISYIGSANSIRLLRSDETNNHSYVYSTTLNGPCSSDGNITLKNSVGTTLSYYHYFFNWDLWVPSCESERVKVTLKLNPISPFNLKDTPRVCSQPPYYHKAPKGDSFSYRWLHNNKTEDSILVDSTRMYALEITNKFGCKTYDSTRIIVDKTPTLNLPDTATYCSNDTLKVPVPLSKDSFVFLWNDGTRDSVGRFTSPGQKTLKVYDKRNFCSINDTLVALSKDPPVFSLGADRVLCGDSFDLSSTFTPVATNTYSYFSDSANAINNSGKILKYGRIKYWVTATDNSTLKCKFTDTIVASVAPNPKVKIGDTFVLCGNNTNIMLQDTNYNRKLGYTYLWNNTHTTKSLTASLPGRYILQVTDSLYGCKGQDTAEIIRLENFTFNLGNDVRLCANSYTIKVPANVISRFNKYSWTGGGNDTTKLVTESGKYKLRVTDSCGYFFEDEIYVQLDKPSTDGAIDLLPDTVYGCGKVELLATSDSIGTQIVWHNSSTSNSIVVDRTQAVSVSVYNRCGSFTKNAMAIVESPPVANFTFQQISYPYVYLFVNNSTLGAKYQWNFGDGQSSNDYSVAHKYTKEGRFRASLTVINSCGSSSVSKELPFIRDTTRDTTFNVGIASANESNSILLYPNPADNQTQIMAKGIENGSYYITITNILGQKVLEDEIKVSNRTLLYIIDTRSFSSGEYFVNIQDEAEGIAVKKLLIMR